MSDYTPTTHDIRQQVAWQWDEGSDDEKYAYAAFDRWLAGVRADAAREAWAEADHAHYPLVMAVESFIDNGGDAWGNLDGAFERVSALRNPYDAEPKEVPEVLPGTLAALNALTIRKEPTND